MTPSKSTVTTKMVAKAVICLVVSPASNYVPLTEGLTGEEAERVQIVHLDNDNTLVKSLK